MISLTHVQSQINTNIVAQQLPNNMDERPEEVIVSLHDGKVRGMKQQSPFFDTEFYSFYGIPYAESPIGDLRFKVGNFRIHLHNGEKHFVCSFLPYML